jgi:hypothetical protein
VAEPTLRPNGGGFSHPHFALWGVAEPPTRAMGWFSHPQTGHGSGSTTPLFSFSKYFISIITIISKFLFLFFLSFSYF